MRWDRRLQMTEPASLAVWQAALGEGERLDDLEYEGRRIIQHMEEARFSLDAVLLARFVQPKHGERILELGTGTGVISLLLAREGLEIEAVELAPRMAELAARNVRLNGLASLVHVVAGDYRKPDELYAPASFSLVVCNPPWYPLGRGKIGRGAAARHEVTATLAETAAAARHALPCGGRLALVFLPSRLDELFAVLKENDMAPRRMQFFLPRLAVAPSFVLVEARVGAAAGAVSILPPLVGTTDEG